MADGPLRPCVLLLEMFTESLRIGGSACWLGLRYCATPRVR